MRQNIVELQERLQLLMSQTSVLLEDIKKNMQSEDCIFSHLTIVSICCLFSIISGETEHPV